MSARRGRNLFPSECRIFSGKSFQQQPNLLKASAMCMNLCVITEQLYSSRTGIVAFPRKTDYIVAFPPGKSYYIARFPPFYSRIPPPHMVASPIARFPPNKHTNNIVMWMLVSVYKRNFPRR